MKSESLTAALLFAITTGCSTSVVDRPVASSAASLQRSDISGRTSATSSVAEASTPTSCVVTGESRIVAPKARLRSGIELAASGDLLFLGFSTEPRDAVAMELDASSGAPVSRSVYHSNRPLRHLGAVAQALADGAKEAPCELDRFESATVLTADRTFVVGATRGELAWAACTDGPAHSLWSVPGGTVQEIQGASLGEGRGFAIALRQDQSIWFGKLDGNMNPDGPLSKVAERSSIRWPALASSGGDVLVVWAEKKEPDGRWSLGGASLDRDGVTQSFLLPQREGPADSMFPALAPIDGGHFLLAWTEGTAEAHEVRAARLDSRGAPLGSSVTVSSGRDGGWSRAAVTSDGRGAVAFLTPTDTGFAVATTPVSCPVTPARREASLLGTSR